MDGVWLPAGGENPRARGFPDSRHKPTARGQGGRAFWPLAAPANGRLANRPSRQGGTGSSRIRDKSNPIPAFPLKKEEGARQKHRELRLLLHLPHMTTVVIAGSPKPEAVCQAGRRVERSR